jgi:hypothetical protein
MDQPLNGLNPEWTAELTAEWTELRMDLTQNGPNSEWTELRMD